uniref:Uncharacterized protein n=1 Tax=Panagrellus redivivus TaxID=6233 RepID=A0A7E4ZSW3_PANRE
MTDLPLLKEAISWTFVFCTNNMLPFRDPPCAPRIIGSPVNLIITPSYCICSVRRRNCRYRLPAIIPRRLSPEVLEPPPPSHRHSRILKADGCLPGRGVLFRAFCRP